MSDSKIRLVMAAFDDIIDLSGWDEYSGETTLSDTEIKFRLGMAEDLLHNIVQKYYWDSAITEEAKRDLRRAMKWYLCLVHAKELKLDPLKCYKELGIDKLETKFY
jgi:hypothetical protein